MQTSKEEKGKLMISVTLLVEERVIMIILPNEELLHCKSQRYRQPDTYIPI